MAEGRCGLFPGLEMKWRKVVVVISRFGNEVAEGSYRLYPENILLIPLDAVRTAIKPGRSVPWARTPTDCKSESLPSETIRSL